MSRNLCGVLLIVAAACGTGTDGTPVAPTTPAPPTTPTPPPAPPAPAPEPTPVTGVKVVESGPDFVVLAWDPVPDATRYQILVDQNESGEWNEHYSSEPSFRLEGLEPGVFMRIVVRVREIAGIPVSWPPSDPVLFPESGPRPVPVTGIHAAEVGPDFVLLAWDPLPGARKYQAKIFLEAGYEWYAETDIREPMLLLDGLEPGSAVKVTVRAIGDSPEGSVKWPWSAYFVAETLPPPLRRCTDERERAIRESEFVLEWDGTPFRVDMIDNFPDYVTTDALASMLGAVGLLADKIEDQLGYRIVEMGEVVPVPAGLPPDWNKDPGAYRRNCWLPRDPGQVYGFYLDGIHSSATPTVGAQAHPRCGAFTYMRPGVERRLDPATGEWPCADLGCTYDKTTMHELFHVLGYRHIDDDEPNEGVPMSRALDDATGALGAQAVTWADIDALRCIFPEGG